jgi:hypothetical protein
MKLPFKIKEIKPQIFLFEFEDQYEMCMHFVRYQEFYESPSSKFRNKPFELIDFMQWYAKENGDGLFTYPMDWAGFNFHGEIIPKLRMLGIKDLNRYDDAMHQGYIKCKKTCNNFYIIGSLKNNEETIKHEVAHGFFQLKQEYKKEMTKLVKKLPSVLREEMNVWLKDHGYTSSVFIDETQAYFATGNYPIPNEEIRKPFIEIFERYYNA